MKYSLLLLLLLFTACMDKHPKFEYSDGNANIYLITDSALKYIPTKPEESSSGVYSGGEPKAVVINTTQYQTLKTLFEQALANTDSHIENRVMMSALISSISEDKKKQCILKPGSADITLIEEALRKAIVK